MYPPHAPTPTPCSYMHPPHAPTCTHPMLLHVPTPCSYMYPPHAPTPTPCSYMYPPHAPTPTPCSYTHPMLLHPPHAPTPTPCSYTHPMLLHEVHPMLYEVATACPCMCKDPCSAHKRAYNTQLAYQSAPGDNLLPWQSYSQKLIEHLQRC